jgi:hypothetical protein
VTPSHARVPSLSGRLSRVLGAARSAPFTVQVGAPTGGTGGGAGGGAGVEPTGPMEVPSGDWDPAEYPALGLPLALGNPLDWTWLWNGGARWNPCRVITWAYNPSAGYGGSLADVQRAFAKVAGRTGLHFKYVGATGFVYHGGNDNPAGVDVVVGWSDAAHLGSLAGGVVGVGWAYPVSGPGVANEIVSGYVVLDRAELLNGGFATGGMPTWGQVMEHEIGHVVGLGHARGDDQLMAASAGAGNHLFGAGDLLGLTLAGSVSGCL